MKKILLAGLCCLSLGQVRAQNNQLFFIDSGYLDGLYYQVASIIALLNTQPSGALSCQAGGACGVENLIMVNRSSHGSTENLARLCRGESDSALVQSNLAYMAYQGEGIFEAKGACKSLRALASLYTEVLQIAVPKASDIENIADLKGKKIGLGASNSGTYHAAQELFAIAGLDNHDVQLLPQSIGEATQALQKKEIDAIIFFAGIPNPAFESLHEKMPLKFLSLNGVALDDFLKRNRSYQKTNIKAGVYAGSEAFESVKVRALWVSTDKLDKDWAYQFSKNLWANEHYPLWLKKIYPKESFDKENALEGIAIPLHEGAKRFYNEIGKRY